MNYLNWIRKKVGLGGWEIFDIGDVHIYKWKSGWATVDYHFAPKEGTVRVQTKGSHPIYAKEQLHLKDSFKYRRLKCQLLALDDGIYHPPEWWRMAVALYDTGRKPRGKKQQEQYTLVVKYINREV